ncbi:hypothetical protein C0993_005228 [Termitomyces sp. T159_Od127]|nr:hypothetical protein C0993_005228 [Termitomyces sp. T159_Od127]
MRRTISLRDMGQRMDTNMELLSIMVVPHLKQITTVITSNRSISNMGHNPAQIPNFGSGSLL